MSDDPGSAERIPLDSIVAILHTLHGTGLNPKDSPGILQILENLKSCISKDDINGWGIVFAWLGGHNPGAARFNVIYAIFGSWRTPGDVREWGPAWMSVMEASNIHPISLCLCAGSWDQMCRKELLALYRRLYPAEIAPKIVRRLDYLDRDLIHPIWEISLARGVTPSNVVSAHGLRVRETHLGKTSQLGTGWCVADLKILEMPGLATVGPMLTVMESLDLTKAHNIKSLGAGSRIGGLIRLRPGMSKTQLHYQDGCFDSLGWDLDGTHCLMNPDGSPEFFVKDLVDPIIFPNSWFRMRFRLWNL